MKNTLMRCFNMLIVRKLRGLILGLPREKVVNRSKLEEMGEMKGMKGMKGMEGMERIKIRKNLKSNIRVGSNYMGK